MRRINDDRTPTGLSLSEPMVTVEMAAGWFGVSRQAYYQQVKRSHHKAAENELVIEMVQEIRQRHPRMGGRKLYNELGNMMNAKGIKRGRDAFFDLLRAQELLIMPKRNGRRTTVAGLWRCPNRLANATLTAPCQAWVGDITYLATEQHFLYLALLTDAYSRYIVGYDLCGTLALEGCLRTFQQAVKAHPHRSLDGLIHHSDHGVQYTSKPYQEALAEQAVLPSMGKVGNCYDNALAERVNGILKLEYRLDDLFVDDKQARQAVKQAIWLYNHERPHLSLDYKKPAEVHFGANKDSTNNLRKEVVYV